MFTAVPRFAVFALGFLSVSLAGFAQAPPPPGGDHPPMITNPVNLKVLPKNTSVYSLLSLMRQYKVQLGVECAYCHSGDAAAKKLNFAADDKPEKQTARLMMAMTNELNSKYVKSLPTGSDMQVSCGTCHRGHAIPPEFVPRETPPH